MPDREHGHWPRASQSRSWSWARRPRPRVRRASSSDRVSTLNVTILSTMLADEGFGEWGFAALVEVDGRRILFDTGANDDTVARNLKALGLDLAKTETVVLRHNHADHTTGLMPLRGLVGVKSKALSTLYVGSGIFLTRLTTEGRTDERMARSNANTKRRAGALSKWAPLRLQPGVWLTGRVPRVHPERNWSGLGKVRLPTGDQDDIVAEDMALVFQPARAGRALRLRARGRYQHAGAHSQDRRSSGRQGDHRRPASVWRRRRASFWTASQLKRFGVQQLVGGALHRRRSGVSHPRALASRQTCMVGAVGRPTLSTRASIRFASRNSFRAFSFQLSAISYQIRP